jgi:hypothetical protein
MKNDYNEEGLKITDIECLDRALKLRQFFRANNSLHAIKAIQEYCVKNSGEEEVLSQEFGKITEEEIVCKIAQETINIITDHTRDEVFGERNEENLESRIAITQISMTKVETYLTRKGRVFLKCIFNQLKKEGLTNYIDLVVEAETERNRNRLKRLESIINAFPTYFRNSANSFDENINIREERLTHLLNRDNRMVPVYNVTTSDLQWILKRALNRISTTNYQLKLDISDDIIKPIQLRQVCKNAKLRNIYFRLIHNDFFTYERMFKFKMTKDPNCPRCGILETTKHLLWECSESRNLWKSYNEILTQVGLNSLNINSYEDLYRVEDLPVLSTIKLKFIQEQIQIIRPKNWSNFRTIQIMTQLRDIELHNADIDNSKMQKRWKPFLKLNLDT